MSYTVNLREMARKPTVVIVGVGGTGSLLADSICRILKNSDIKLLLVDMDRVEEHNLLRQNYYAGDIGKFKSQVLAERLSHQYGRPIGYSVMPYEKDMFDTPSPIGTQKAMNLIILGCVDSAAARRSIADTFSAHFMDDIWWLDSGNGHSSGQILIGNVKEKGSLKESFDADTHTVSKLPIPSVQLPALLIPPTVPERPRDCAEAVEDDAQSPTINQAMATLMTDFTWKLLSGKLTSMAAYVDLDAGTLQYVPAAPLTVARMLSMGVDELMANRCALGARYHV
jgi:PRTRC genetic system ThiF family protein